jgi:hypothetical protein
MGGLLLGSLCLAAILLVLSLLVPVLGDRTAEFLAVSCLSLLALGDVWSLSHNRSLYPFGARRQTVQALMFGRRREAVVGLVWGLDAGLGLRTYRSTSGLWAVSCLAILGIGPWWSVIGYGAGFAAALAVVIWTPTPGDDGEMRAAAAARRVERLAQSGGVASRVAYLAVLLVAIAILGF